MLNILDHIPEGLLEASHTELYQLLGGPTLIHLPGRREQPLFISVLLHGNEDTSYYAMLQLLKQYQHQELPRALSIFIGNVEAAAQSQRRLNGQPDYNRVWPGCEEPELIHPEQAVMQTVFNEMKQRDVFASIDIHNNTGLNPHYGCINSLDERFLHLATMFSRTVVYFLRPKGVQSMAFAQICPAVTIECGKVGEQRSVNHALEFVNACLHLSEHPQHPLPRHDIDLFHTMGLARIKPSSSFSFDTPGSDLCFAEDIDHLNFREIPPGTTFCYGSDIHHFEVINEAGDNVTENYLTTKNGEIFTTRSVMPSMLTTDEQVIRQDCLCYLMERVPLDNIDPETHALIS